MVDSTSHPARLPRTLALLEAARAAGLHLGGQLYVSRNREAIADLAFGEAEPGHAMTSGHRMLWLSSTKPVTAVAIGQLWERGLLALDDRVSKHVPEFAAGGKGAITIRHLLTHTGGFRMPDVGFPKLSWDEIVARVAASKIEPRWEPGRKAGYHQESSWFILGEIVRRLDGRSFERYVREAIFAPLGMSASSIGMPDAEFDAIAASLAPIWNTELSPPVLFPWHSRERVVRSSPGGNGWGPVRELALFYEDLLATIGGRGAGVLRPATVEALVARHRVGLLDHTFRAMLDWGLGFIPDSSYHGEARAPYQYGRHASPRAFGHSGYRSSVAFADPELGLVVALAVNGTPSDDAHFERFRTVLEAIYEELASGA